MALFASIKRKTLDSVHIPLPYRMVTVPDRCVSTNLSVRELNSDGIIEWAAILNIFDSFHPEQPVPSVSHSLINAGRQGADRTDHPIFHPCSPCTNATHTIALMHMDNSIKFLRLLLSFSNEIMLSPPSHLISLLMVSVPITTRGT